MIPHDEWDAMTPDERWEALCMAWRLWRVRDIDAETAQDRVEALVDFVKILIKE